MSVMIALMLSVSSRSPVSRVHLVHIQQHVHEIAVVVVGLAVGKNAAGHRDGGSGGSR